MVHSKKWFFSQCPHCDHKLEKIPKTTEKCPQCKKDIYVRGGLLVTGNQAIFIDWFDLLRFAGVDTSELDKFENDPDGIDPSELTETCWKILEDAIPKSTDHKKLEGIYSIMAGNAESVGKDPLPYRRKEREHELLYYMSKYRTISGDPIIVRVMNDKNHDTCDRCSELAQRW